MKPSLYKTTRLVIKTNRVIKPEESSSKVVLSSDGYSPPPDAIREPVDAPSAWSSPSDLGKTESDGRNSPQGVAPHANRGVAGVPVNAVYCIYVQHQELSLCKIQHFVNRKLSYDESFRPYCYVTALLHTLRVN